MGERQPDWIPVTSLSWAAYECQFDLNARPGEMRQYRHRRRVFTGQPEPEWIDGPPPAQGGDDART